MKLAELLNTVVSSEPNDWNHIVCWGAGSGPSYHSKLEFHDIYNSHPAVLHSVSHGSVAVYEQNINITLAYGLTASDDFREEWANKFPDPTASSHYLDVFYSNALVYRDMYVNIDGGRAKLPLPQSRSDLVVAKSYSSLIRLLNSIGGYISEYDRYLKWSGIIEIDDGPLDKWWPGDSRRLNPQQLAKIIRSHFSLTEIEQLCFNMNINHEEIRGTTVNERARELVTYCGRRGTFETLVQQVRNERPEIKI